MSVLAFRLPRPAAPALEVRLSDALQAETLVRVDVGVAKIALMPEWVLAAGYRAVSYRVPRLDEMFFDAARDKVKTCGQWRHDGVETREFVILEYKGGPT